MKQRWKLGGATLLTVVALFIGGCGKGQPTYTGKADHTPYDIKQCLRELSTGAEFREDQRIDRLVAYKSRRNS